MRMFDCCKNDNKNSGQGYLVHKQNQKSKFYPSLQDIKESDIKDPNTSILKVNKADYQLIDSTLKSKNEGFVDGDFTPGEIVLGSLTGVMTDKWRRVSDLVSKPVIFGKEITPADATNFKLGSHSFHAAVAALAQRPEVLQNIFQGQRFNPKGLYTFILRKNGILEEILIDDYIPVSKEGTPLFSNSSDTAIWMPLLEKAMAKSYGSYEKLISKLDNPCKTFEDITYAPAESIRTPASNEKEKQDDLWVQLENHLAKKRAICVQTHPEEKMDWKTVNLLSNHYYTVLDVGELTHKLGNTYKIVKLRDAFLREVVKGEGSSTDSLFWDQIEEGEAKSRLLATVGSQEGIIFILFPEYLRYISQTNVSLTSEAHNYISEPLIFKKKNGLVSELQIYTDGDYVLSIDQYFDDNTATGKALAQGGYGRSTIVVLKEKADKKDKKDVKYNEYVDGTLKYNQQQAILKTHLTAGKYLVYTKIDPHYQSAAFPNSSNFIIYSSASVTLHTSNQWSHPNLLRQALFHHARTNIRQLYNNDFMWSSWKLFANGGYAYIAFGNNVPSKCKFVVKFSEQVFNQQNYILKKPFKGKGEQTVEVLPGQQEIILLRVKNSPAKQIHFPPTIDVQLVSLE